MKRSINLLLGAGAVLLCTGAAPRDTTPATLSPELLPPMLIEAGGKPIDVDVGHAAPFFADIDGDGKRDLLVGQFGGGKLRIYKNAGTNEQPKFDDFQWFKAGADLGVVPAG